MKSKNRSRASKVADAARALRHVERQKKLPQATCDMLAALFNSGHFADLEAQTRSVVEQYPASGFAWKMLGASLQCQGKAADALPAYRRSIELMPDDPGVYANVGNSLKALGLVEEAVVCHRQAVEIDPSFALAHCGLGTALLDLGQAKAAIASLTRAVEIKPDYALAHTNLGLALQSVGQLEDAETSHSRALDINPDLGESHSNLLLVQNYMSSRSADLLLRNAKRFGDWAEKRAQPCKEWLNSRESSRCLRVGFVSGDFREHPVGFFIESLLSSLAADASERMQLMAYSNHSRSDGLTDRIREHCLGWRQVVGLSDENLANLIKGDGIDVLIDLSGHTGHNRLPMFAWKPAPIQVTWLGYLGTTGVKAVDYLIADSWTLPPSEETKFSEKVFRLPETYICFSPPNVEISPGALPALSAGHITFGSFNNMAKVNDSVIDVWSTILTRMPESKLFLKSKQIVDEAARKRLLEKFARHDIDDRRLILEGHTQSYGEHYAAYQRVDIALDPFPYPGITTTIESLWMGVPVLTLSGERFVSRQGIGLLTNAGLSDWIADDVSSYVEQAVIRAGNVQDLSILRAGLRAQVMASPIFNTHRFARHFEAALRGMWTSWCARSNGPNQIGSAEASPG